MKTRGLGVGLALVLATTAWAVYQYYYTDNFASIDTSKWTVNGYLSGSANGLSGGGSLISTVTPPNGNDYDVQMTVHVADPQWCFAMGRYELYARSASDASSYYKLAWNGGWSLVKRTYAGFTTLAALPGGCSDGMVMRMLVRGSQITVWANSTIPFTTNDSDLTTGKPGVGIWSGSDTITNAKLGPIDSVAPSPITQGSISSVASLHRVDLKWGAVSDDINGIGIGGYTIYRDGVKLGDSPTTVFWDETVSPGSAVTYSLQAYDQHWNYSTATTYAVTVPTSPGDESRIGVRPDGAYWGSAGEQIDMQSGNLNFSLPILKALGRGGWGVTFALSYNSQMWRSGNGSVWLSGEDLGQGLGWKLQAGSIRPVYFNQSIDHYVYSDATGVEYRLDQNSGGGIWTSLDSTYVTFNANTGKLFFPDGSFWTMGAISTGSEQDAGTMYPTRMQDTNGNTIAVFYAPASGQSANTSSRIKAIFGTRCLGYVEYSGTAACTSGGGSYTFSYNYDAIPHLTSISNNLGTPENYSFTVGTQYLYEPFGSTRFSADPVTTLGAVTVAGLNIAHQFTYDTFGELTQVTTPLGGILAWAYDLDTYGATQRKYNVVNKRYLQSSSVGTRYEWDVDRDAAQAWHGTTTLTDVGAGYPQKIWSFSTDPSQFPGLATAYEEHDVGRGAVLLRKEFTWAKDNQAGQTGRPYVNTVLTKQYYDNGASHADTKTVQTVELHGNLTQSQVFDSTDLNTPARTYNYYFLAGSNYTDNFIYNRLTSATVRAGTTGSPLTLVTNSYDGSPAPTCTGIGGLTASSAQSMHDATYGTSFLYRGNLTQTAGLSGVDISCNAYDTAGLVVQTVGPTGLSVAMVTGSSTNYSLPDTITPNSDSNLTTSISYASSFAATQVVSNGATASTSYDSVGRPSSSTIPDGATTSYTYLYYSDSGNTSHVNSQAATVNQRWRTTTLDGFGRPIRVQMGHGTTVLSTVDTEYAPCACSPLLKLKRVSQPYAPNGAVVWTTYTYDGRGRTVSVTAPDGASATGYSYAGNSTTVTDAANKQKTSTVDVFGNLKRMTEPNPAGGTFTTDYTYSLLNQLTGVTMIRGAVTQTRTFNYTGGDLMSAANPENGTVSYTYNNAHQVVTRTDAMGQQTVYDRDIYGRVTEVRYYLANQSEDTRQRVDYYYDTNPVNSTYTQHGAGRLNAVKYGGGPDDDFHDAYYYMYSYNSIGRMTDEKMGVLATIGGYIAYPWITFSAAYQWDNEGRMTSMQNPLVTTPDTPPGSPINLGLEAFSYDTDGRMTGMTWNGNQYASASYGPAGEMTALSYADGMGGTLTENRTYNNMLQLTHQVVTGYMDMTYNYSSTANNGRITSSVDGVTTENTTYTYDVLNRLTGASNSLWTAAYGYDGFGNLTSKSGTGGAPSMTATYDGNNHQTALTYDANGNLAGPVYSVENRMIRGAAGSPIYAYDPSGKRIMTQAAQEGTGGNNYQFSFYGITGQRLATVGCTRVTGQTLPTCSILGQNVYFKGKLLVSNGVAVVTDRLGSVRKNRQGESFSYYPYGEERTNTADGRDKFGTYFRDSAGQDYADQRYYGAGSGRFMTADPYQASGGLADPSSWNRYAYTRGDPANRIDPNGMADYSVTGYCYGCFDSTGPSSVSSNADRSVWGSDNGRDHMLAETGDGERDPVGGVGVDPDPPKPAICDSKILQPQFTAIFAQMGKDLGVDPTFIMAISLQESGKDLNHVFETNSSSGGKPLNNLFGSTYGGGNNIPYDSVQDSATAWEKNWGSYLSNHPTSIQGFVAALLSDPKHMYNSNPDYTASIVGGDYPVPIKLRNGTVIKRTHGTYPSVKDWIATCDIKF